MDELLSKNIFLVKEHVGMFKAANNYDILDPETGEVIMECREENMGFFTKMARFSDYKTMTPFDVVVRIPGGADIVRVKRGFTFFQSQVQVENGQGQPIGKFKQKMMSIGGKFAVFDEQDNELFTLKGKWTGWEFKFMAGDQVLAEVSKKWAGLGKEFFTSADNYVLKINESVPAQAPVRKLILASVVCIDMVLRE